MIVSTPGRLIDLLTNSRSIHLENLKTLVLDEGDKLMEMGFKESIVELLKLCGHGTTFGEDPVKKSDATKLQTLMFSATLTGDVKELARLALTDPVPVRVAEQQSVASPAVNLTHLFVKLREESGYLVDPATGKLSFKNLFYREAVLLALCTRYFTRRVIVFFNEKVEVHRAHALF